MAKIDLGKDFDKEEHLDNMAKKMETTKPYYLNIPASLYKKVKRKLLEEEKTMSSVIIKALHRYLSE